MTPKKSQLTDETHHHTGHVAAHDDRGIRRDPAEIADAASRSIRELGADARSLAEDAGRTVQGEAERAAELAREGGEQAQELYRQACGVVRRHPTAAVLTSLGVGLLVGRVLGGR